MSKGRAPSFHQGVPSPEQKTQGDTMARTYAIPSAATAIARKDPSAPARMLHMAGLLKGRCLDYGCGRGKDAETYGMDRYDPEYFPAIPEGKYDTITCTYVLNVVHPEVVPNVLSHIRRLLARGGRAYISVRRDLGKKDRKGRGTVQRHVTLDLPLLKNERGYCTYMMSA